MGGGNSIPLEDGALTYLLADAKAARPVLELIPIRGTDKKQTAQILDRTKTVAAALYPPESGRRFQLAAWGSFSSGMAGMAFGTSKDWKKIRSSQGYSYWYSQANALSVTMNAGQAYVSASSGAAPTEPLGAGSLRIPREFAELGGAPALFCWFEKPGPMLNQFLQALGLPLQIPAERMFVSLAGGPTDDGFQYGASVRIETPTESQARALVSLISMARAFSQGLSGGLPALLFANAPVLDGKYLNIKTAPLGEKEITLLFSYFPVN
jgi:hypothetical protein